MDEITTIDNEVWDYCTLMKLREIANWLYDNLCDDNGYYTEIENLFPEVGEIETENRGAAEIFGDVVDLILDKSEMKILETMHRCLSDYDQLDKIPPY